MSDDREQITIPPDKGPEDQQPAWRQDFPVDWPQDHYVARRDFTKFMVLTSLAFAVGQFWIGTQNFFRRRRGAPEIMPIATLDEVPVGGTVTFNYPTQNDPCLLVRPSEDILLAYSQKCTHLACAVVPKMDEGCFHCPCHAGFFDINTGRALSGPPRRPLPRIVLEIRGEHIYAKGVEVSRI